MSEHLKGPEQSRRYEDSNVSVKQLFAFAMGVVAMVMVGVLGSAVAFRFFVLHTPMGPSASPFEDVRDLPPESAPANQCAADLKTLPRRAGQNFGRIRLGGSSPAL